MNSDSLLQRMKILIVDDEPANVALLQEILVENGYARMEAVRDSKLALEACKKFQPDLILLDLMMPPPDGFAILESLRSENDENFLPVVVLTADTSEETKRRALEAGATDSCASRLITPKLFCAFAIFWLAAAPIFSWIINARLSKRPFANAPPSCMRPSRS